MRLVFAGTPLFAAQALGALIDAGHEIVAVLTQPDRKAGRGLRSIPGGPVKALAIEHGLQVLQPVRLNEPATLEHLRSLCPEVVIVAAYGLIFPQPVLELAPRGAINIHASLLPRWRGAAPIQRAILAGDTQTGITLMQMDAGLDTGAMLAQGSITIAPDETAGSLHDRLALLGAKMTVELLRTLQSVTVAATPQPVEGVSYARKIDKSEALLDWRKSCASLDREIRAFNPVPGARTSTDGFEVKVWRAHILAGSGEPGLVQSASGEGVIVTCGQGALALTELQRAGGKRLSAREFLRGHPLSAGSRFAMHAD
jgi:methionyl-tRNA formyltransferase